MNGDIPDNPQDIKQGKKRRGRQGKRERPWDLGVRTRVAPRPPLSAQFQHEHPSVVSVGDNPTLPSQTKQKTTPEELWLSIF